MIRCMAVLSAPLSGRGDMITNGLNLIQIIHPPLSMLLNPALFRLPLSEIREYGEETLTYGSLTENGLAAMSKKIRSYMPNIYGLDLGCGDGELIYHLQKTTDAPWDGVEISAHRINM